MRGSLSPLPRSQQLLSSPRPAEMKAVALFLCLLGAACATPAHPSHHELGAHGQEAPGKGEAVAPEASRAGGAGPGAQAALLPQHRALGAEVPGPGAERGAEPRAAGERAGMGSQQPGQASPSSSSSLAPRSKPGLASEGGSWRSSFSSSSRLQPGPPQEQLRRQQKRSTVGSWHPPGKARPPLRALSLQRELHLGKDNQSTVALPGESRESGEGGGVGEEEEEEEWGEAAADSEVKQGGLQPRAGHQPPGQQREERRQAEESLRGARQAGLPTRSHGEKAAPGEEERQETQGEGEAAPSPRAPQEGRQRSPRGGSSLQGSSQGEESRAENRQEREGRGAAAAGQARGGTAGEEELSSAWKEEASEEEERMQRNAQERARAEQQGEGSPGEDPAAQGQAEGHQGGKGRGFQHPKEGDHKLEPLHSDSQEQVGRRSSAQSLQATEREAQVKSPGSSRAEVENASTRSQLALQDPCRNFHCKKGRVCQVGKEGRAACICQDPAACPSTKDYEHVCGTDNKTYPGTCQLFGTKCQLEGTKLGQQLHLDYMGSCKAIPPCSDSEAAQFPLRMRDWLKNILLQFYRREPGGAALLTERQRSTVQKLYQNEQHLGAGAQALELLLPDFEQHYQLYVYPVHWQFHQLDLHPADRLLSHSELAPLRASLVPLEHCITRFFQECDGDQDKLIALQEWCHCFGIKEEDINESLLF